jgi:predicted transposase/invertase (TIGR01784 family)
VYCKDQYNNHFIIEMQSLNEYNFFERAQYYAARALGNQLKAVNDYIHLLPVVFVGVVDYSLDKIKRYKRFEEFRKKSIISLEENFESLHQDVISKYSFINKQTNRIIPVPLMELNFVELPNFTKSIEECITEVDQWLYLMKNADECDEIPEQMKKQEVLVEAFYALEQKNWTPEDLRKYVEEREAFGKEDRIREGDLEYAEEYAEERGRLKEKQAMAIKLLEDGFDNLFICKMTGLSTGQIKDLQKKNK